MLSSSTTPALITVPRSADAQFAATPVIFFRAVLRRTTARSFVKRVAVVTPRGMLYLCTYDARATRSLYLGSLQRVLLDSPLVALESDDGSSILLNLGIQDDISHAGSTLTNFISICACFSPSAEFVQDSALHVYHVADEAGTKEKVGVILEGKGINAIASGLQTFHQHASTGSVRVTVDAAARNAPPRIEAPDDDELHISGLPALQLDTSERPTPAHTPQQVSIPLRPVEAPPIASPPPAPPLAPPSVLYFSPLPDVEALLKTKKPVSRLPVLRAEQDWLAMMAFVVVQQVNAAATPLEAAATQGAAEPGVALDRKLLLTVAPTGVANVWEGERTKTTFNMLTDLVALHVSTAAECTLSIVLPGRPLPVRWLARLKEGNAGMNQLVRAAIGLNPKVQISIDKPPPVVRPASTSQPSSALPPPAINRSITAVSMAGPPTLPDLTASAMQRLRQLEEMMREQANIEEDDQSLARLEAEAAQAERWRRQQMGLSQLIGAACDRQRMLLHLARMDQFELDRNGLHRRRM